MRKLDERVYLKQVESSALVKWHSTHNKGTATHCNTLQHTARHLALRHGKKIYEVSLLLNVPYPSL